MITNLLTLYLAGLVGSLGMDLISPLADRLGFRTGVTIPLIGRWFIALLSGRLHHADIRQAPAHPREALAGWVFHYLIGGGVVALLALPLIGDTIPTDAVTWIGFGLITSVLPWLILMPAFGWGLFGHRGPEGARPLIASPLNHLGYGLGIWLALMAQSAL